MPRVECPLRIARTRQHTYARAGASSDAFGMPDANEGDTHRQPHATPSAQGGVLAGLKRAAAV